MKLTCSLACAGLMGTAWHAGAQTQPTAAAEDAAIGFDIPAQSLGTALNAVGRQAGVPIASDTALLAGKTAPALKGNHTLRKALRLLLVGSGLEAVLQAGSVVVRRETPPVAPNESTLPEIRVKASAETLPGDIPKPYAGGQVARGSRQGMLGNTEVFGTPFSTKAYTAELMRNQGARNINDVVANDPSIRVSLSPTAPLDQSSIRGFVGYGDAYLFDGVQGLVSYSSLAVQNYERVEVFKGPSAALNGAGASGSAVGGSFNLVPKRATDDPVQTVTLSATDKSLLGAHVDLGSRFGTDNAFGIRLNFSTEEGEFFNDSKRTLIAPLVALDYRGEKVRVTLDAGTIRYESTAAFTNRTLLPGAALPAAPDPRTNPNAAWETLQMEQAFGLLSAEWDVTPNWTAYARHGRFHEEPRKRTYLNTTSLDSAGGFTITGASSYLWEQDNAVSEVGARGKLNWGSTQHQLAINAVRDREAYHNERFVGIAFATPVAANIYMRPTLPDPFTSGVPDVEGSDYPPTYLTSFAVADTVSMLDDRFRLTVAARHQQIEADVYDESRLTPTLAALYTFGGGLSAYGNYAESLAQGETAPDTAANAGRPLPPYVSRQHEFGLKWDRGTYGLTTAYFDIRKPFAYVASDNVFRAGGQQRNRGLELETFGELRKGLRLLGGVAWIDAKQSRTEGGATDGKRAIGVPAFTANLGTEVDLAVVPGLTLTGRFIHTGSAYVDLGNTQRVPDWQRVDVGARLRTQVASQPLTLRVGIDNLLDKNYWTIGGRNFISVASPRTWKLSATMAF